MKMRSEKRNCLKIQLKKKKKSLGDQKMWRIRIYGMIQRSTALYFYHDLYEITLPPSHYKCYGAVFIGIYLCL